MGNCVELCKENCSSDKIINVKVIFNKSNQYDKTSILNSSPNYINDSNIINNSIISNKIINTNIFYHIKNIKKFQNESCKNDFEKNISLESSFENNNFLHEKKISIDEENNQKENSKHFNGPIITHLLQHSKHKKKS